MAVGDVYRLTVLATVLGSIQMNSVAVTMKSSPDPSVSDCASLANATANVWRSRQTSAVAWTNWTFHQLWGGGMTTVQDECRRENAKIVIGNFTAGFVGTGGSGELLPPQCAAVVTLATGIAGRRRRGRLYGFGFGETDQSNGTWGSSFITALQANLVTWVALYGPTGTDPQFQTGVWSERRASGCWVDPVQKKLVNIETPHPEDAFTALTGTTLRSIVYTQRRRTLGVGR
jgi:hypothetical protein